jgi:heme-degrading monooxygenase HmoA
MDTQDSPGDQTYFRIDRFTVPAAAVVEFTGILAEIDTFLGELEGCLQHHVLREGGEGTSGDAAYMTVVEWTSLAAITKAREAIAAKHAAMRLNPRELFERLHIAPQQGTYVPLAAAEA